jgi:NADPH-dependent 2,4-dienoyl-CoA reductase/sulfur reductase-like enzyme
MMHKLARKHTPTLIVGAGPAGLAAAVAASARGEAVTIIDDNPLPGGQIWRGGPNAWQDARAIALWNALQQREHVRVLYETRVVDAEGLSHLLLETPEGPQRWTCERLILCTGARELLLPFPGWTLPGVTGAGGLQALIKNGMPVAGKRVVVAGSGPLLLAAAKTVRDNGGEVVAIAERRNSLELAGFAGRLALSHRAKLQQAAALVAALRGVPYLHRATATEAHGAINVSGYPQLRAVSITHGGRAQKYECDFLACGYGLVPSLELARLLNLGIAGGRVTVDDAQRASVAGIWAAGEATGIGGVDKALAEGRIAGLAATGQPCASGEFSARENARAFAALLNQAFAPDRLLRNLLRPDTIVCRCEDVTAAQLAEHGEWRAAKLITRCGMGPCQGRICGTACEFLYGWQAPGVRQPVFPITASSLAHFGKDVGAGQAVES